MSFTSHICKTQCHNSLQAVFPCWVAQAVPVHMPCFPPVQEWESFVTPVPLKTFLLRRAVARQQLKFFSCCAGSALKAELCWFHQELLYTHKHSLMFSATWDMSGICALIGLVSGWWLQHTGSPNSFKSIF